MAEDGRAFSVAQIN